jgi:heat shock protein HspQ
MMVYIKQAKFNVGELVHHKLFGYRGVVVDVDASYQGTEEWYEKIARSRPPKDEPWYHVLVDEGDQNTYVAERNLEYDLLKDTIDHPLVNMIFNKFENGAYVIERWTN